MVRPIKIGLLMHASSSWMGGAVYIQNFVKAIATFPIEDRIKIHLCLITSTKTTKKFYDNLLPLVDEHYPIDFLSTKPLSRISRLVEKYLPVLENFLATSSQLRKVEDKVDFFYPLIGEREIFWKSSRALIAWIPDFQHKHLPQFFSKKEIKRRDILHKKMSSNAKCIVFSSETVLTDYNKFYPSSNAKKIVLKFHTIPEDIWFKEEYNSAKNKYNLPKIYFLVSNQFWQHKNHKIIVEALNILKEKSIFPFIVCTGKLHDNRNPKYGKYLSSLIEEYQLQNQFFFLGLIPRIDQIQLMRQSAAVIQPSLFEGWSTVVEDARSLGKDILLSDIPVHIEQNPPRSTYFSAHSAEDLALKMTIMIPRLKPGPDLNAENIAREEQKKLNRLYAEQFLNLIDQVNKSS